MVIKIKVKDVNSEGHLSVASACANYDGHSVAWPDRTEMNEIVLYLFIEI